MPQNRTLLLMIGLTGFAMLGVALYLQHVKEMMPCALCVFQRYAILFVGIFSLIAASANKTKIWTGLALFAALCGVGTIARHLYVLAHPGFSCGIDPAETFLNKIPTATMMPWLFKAEGLCEDARDLVLGLSIPQWSAVGFAVVTLGLVIALVRRR